MSTNSSHYDPLQNDLVDYDTMISTTIGSTVGIGSVTTSLNGNLLSNGLNSGTFTITGGNSPWGQWNTNVTTGIQQNTSPWGSPWITAGTSITPSTLHVNGDANFEGNIKVKGVDLVEALEKIEKRLNILRVNKELEERWEELRELGEKYRALEQEIITREEVWNALKS